MPGKLDLPAPIFLDANGVMMQMESPVIGAPEGEIIQGTAMDIGEEKDEKGKGENEQDEDPQISAAQK